MLYLLISLIIIVGIFLILLFKSYYALLTYQRKVEDVVNNLNGNLNKRVDLISILIKIVRNYTDNEKIILENLNESHKLILNAHTIVQSNQANNNLLDHLKVLFNSLDKYPEITEDNEFINVCNDLNQLNKSIEDSRIDYNKLVFDFNNVCERFPNNLFKNILGFREKDYFKGYSDLQNPSLFDFKN